MHASLDQIRGSGRTSRQMVSAPNGAVFICLTPCFAKSYASDLAHHLGRVDLKLVGPCAALEAWRGTDRAIVVDHATDLAPRICAEIEARNATIRLRHAYVA